MDDYVYLPFWILLDYIKVPDQPFIKCQVTKQYHTAMFKNNEITQIECCDLQLPDNQMAHAIPIEYLISPEDLNNWMQKIADWFLSYVPR